MTAGCAARRGLAVAAIAAAALLASCRSPGSARLQGRWQGQRAEGVGAEVQAVANAFAAETRIEVKSDVMTVVSGRDRQVGRYRVVSEHDDTVVITTDRDGPEHPATFKFSGDDTMTWAALDGKQLVFARE
jgi:hypothetical protein